jgi:hypothetical protein
MISEVADRDENMPEAGTTRGRTRDARKAGIR